MEICSTSKNKVSITGNLQKYVLGVTIKYADRRPRSVVSGWWSNAVSHNVLHLTARNRRVFITFTFTFLKPFF